MGGAVYLLMGLGAKSFSVVSDKARKLWYTIVAVCAVVLVSLLFNESVGVLRTSMQERAAQDAAVAWLEGTDYRVVDLTLDEGELYIQIAGTGAKPPLSKLARSLEGSEVGLTGLSVSVVDERRISLSEE